MHDEKHRKIIQNNIKIGKSRRAHPEYLDDAKCENMIGWSLQFTCLEIQAVDWLQRVVSLASFKYSRSVRRGSFTSKSVFAK